ncbi:MAG: DUF2156 domain-containing protein [Candidatus Lokiarchaeota archaeon]|nr:DUF2156 domain-containing protein [Candidatus Lokiarchaeota archaeon]
MELTNAEKIRLEDKTLFDKYFQKYPPQNSEFTFTNLFMWRNFYELLFLEWKEHLIIFSYEFFKKHKSPLSERKEAIFFFSPIGPNPSDIMIEIFEHIKEAEFHRVPEEVYETLIKHERFQNLNISVVEDRDNWDYVYEVKNLISLPGNQYRQNRRWLQKFFDNYKYEFKILTEDLIDMCKKLQLEWCIARECEEDEGLEQEQKAIYEALDNFAVLRFKGAMICIDEKCAAYTFGEMLNPETVVIHIEKAHMQYDGGYQAINNLFLKSCWENVKLVNREQDLGVAGLRRAKESYKPIRMVKKSVIFRR